MPILRACLVLALVVFVAACDSSEPGSDSGALLTVNAVGASGAPVSGLDVFATYGSPVTYESPLQPSPLRHGSPTATLEVAQPYPTPATTVCAVRFTVSEAGPVRVRAFDLAGAEQAVLLDESVAAGTSQVAADVSDWQAGAYRVVVEAGDETAEQFLLVTDSAFTGEAGLVISLGRTDAQGRLAVTDSTRFPALFDVPSRYIVLDDTGNALGEFRIGREVGVVLRNQDGSTVQTTAQIGDGSTEVDLTFGP